MAALIQHTGFLRPGAAHLRACAGSRPPSSRAALICHAAGGKQQQQVNRRELLLNGVNIGLLAALVNWGTTPRPSGLGVRDYDTDYGSLSLCPSTPNCISTSEAANDEGHYVPPLSYNPEEGRGRSGPVSQEQAMQELVDVVERLKPDKFTPKIITRTADYLYVEYESPTFGFTDDVEFWFPKAHPNTLEYRSASRIGESDGNINRKRIRAIRKELEKVGWKSVGF